MGRIALSAVVPLLLGITPAAAAEADVPAIVQTLADERALIRLADGLDIAVDAKDWTAARAAFADDIAFAFGAPDAPLTAMRADDLVALWRQNLHPAKTSFHLRGNHMVTVDGDTATMRSHGYAWNRLPGLEGGDLWEVWGVYTYAFARQDGEWRITAFRFTPLHDRGNAAVPAAPAPQ
jgi:ketosteroid isomerase-like protein